MLLFTGGEEDWRRDGGGCLPPACCCHYREGRMFCTTSHPMPAPSAISQTPAHLCLLQAFPLYLPGDGIPSHAHAPALPAIHTPDFLPPECLPCLACLPATTCLCLCAPCLVWFFFYYPYLPHHSLVPHAALPQVYPTGPGVVCPMCSRFCYMPHFMPHAASPAHALPLHSWPLCAMCGMVVVLPIPTNLCLPHLPPSSHIAHPHPW